MPWPLVPFSSWKGNSNSFWTEGLSLWLRTSDAHSSMSAFEAPAEAHVHLSSSQASKTALCLTSLLPGPPLPLQSPLACHLECPNQLFLVESSSALG